MRLVYSDIRLIVNHAPVFEQTRTFHLPTDSNYAIELTNLSDKTVSYTILIDGKRVGTYLLAPRQTWTVDRPVDRAFRFFFVERAKIPELAAARETGRLTVEERLCVEDALQPDSAHATVLRGRSRQEFAPAADADSRLVAVFFMDMRAEPPYILL